MKKFTILFLLIIGTANLTQAQWGGDVRLTNDTAISYVNNLQCIVASGDSIHVVWVDNRDGNIEIYYKRSTNKGISWGTDTRLTNAVDTSYYPFIGLSGSNLHVVWSDKRDGNDEIYYKHSTDGGLSWGADTRLTNDPGRSIGNSMAVSGSNIYVVWDDNREGTYKSFFKRSTDGGNTWGSDLKISSTSTNPPSIAVSGSDVHVVWPSAVFGNWEIVYKHSTNSGDSWGSETRLTNNVANSFIPRIQISGSFVHVIWIDDRDGNYEIYYKQSVDKGLTWGVDTRLTNASGDSWYSRLAVSGLGVHIVWQDNRNGKEEIFYKCSKNGGESWSSDTLLTNNNGTLSGYPSVALSGSMVFVAWYDKRDGPNGEIYFKCNPTGNPTGVNDLKQVETEFMLYPNPASGNLSISISNTELSNKTISIFNSLGIEVKQFNEKELSGKSTISFSIESHPTGVYYCLMSDGIGKTSRSFVVLR
ncbi:MAG: T9SS type A sorting domain-containing protein [Bacteroidota bacterium]|nr:T9SS type A sorting domain-containing protein [Bacteroidota bacterium]